MRTIKFWSGLEIMDLIRWRKEGVKLIVIANRLKRTFHSVQNKLHRLDIVLYPQYKAKKKNLFAKIRRALLNGDSVTDASERFGVHYSYVSVVRKKVGIPAVTPAQRLSKSWIVRKVKGQLPPNRWRWPKKEVA